jgi:dolichyl-diphosphooligosaccharide--protein glycosyltransferase
MVTAREVRDLLDERPDLEPALEAVLEPPAPWTFEDVAVDSGAFGELVSRDIVVEADEGYRVADPEAIRDALDGAVDDADSRSGGVEFEFPDFEISRFELAALAGALVLVAAFRLVPFPAVFQNDVVVLSSNDPYYYRYWVEQLLANPETTLSSLPGGVSKGEPLLVATLWLATVALGGTTGSAGFVLAWYPVLSAVLTGVLLYSTAVLLTDDRRIGIASVTMLAVLPSHAFRTSVGFADHHAFEYLWIALTVFGVVLIVTRARSTAHGSTSVVGGVAAIAVGVAAQTLAWEAGPLLVVPLGATIAVMAVSAVHRDESVLETVGPLVVGVGLAAALAWGGHSTYGWHTTLVATSPSMLAAAGIGVLVAGEIWYRLDLPAIALVAVEAVGLGASAAVFRAVRPEMWSRLTSSVTDRLLARREIAEVQSLFSESAGWLLLFGFLLLIALPYLVWASRRLTDDDRWTPIAVYGWYFLLLAAIQVRFAGQLSLLIAIFAGIGFVHLASWIDVARPPAPLSGVTVARLTVPDRRQAFTLVGLFLLVAGLSIVQVPIKTSQITAPNEGYDAAAWMAEYSDDRDMEYPENYVFSHWGDNRMYNYFVSGESRSYGFARSNYATFVTSEREANWYERLRNRVGFVVTTPDVVTNDSAIGTRLHALNGSHNGSASGLAHYRLVDVEKGGEYKIFTIVDGAVLEGETTANATVTVRTTVELESYSFEYVRQTTADANGTYRVRVAHPGTYAIGEQRVDVPVDAVRNGTTVRVDTNLSTSVVSGVSAGDRFEYIGYRASIFRDGPVTLSPGLIDPNPRSV